MTNAAIFLHPNAFDTSGSTLLGRHSAGESFLRGFMRHADVDQFHMWNIAGAPEDKIAGMVRRIEPTSKPINWIASDNRRAVAQVGVVNIPSPQIDDEAWLRMPLGSRAYSLCGVTHTTATATVMRLIPDLLVAPLEDYDTLICTSAAVRSGVETQLEIARAWFNDSFGPRRRPEPQRTTIPLGVNCDDFQTRDADRAAWRERLQIPDDAIVVLYVGRFSIRTKMNPALMALALEKAAGRTQRQIVWVNSGWMDNTPDAAWFHEEISALCPSVRYLHVDGRPPDTRFSIWSVADLFISFSDNIQETFGLTPVEAMAAGLPCVVSDWDGYKDTVRDGLDGVRVPTTAPRPGYGGDLAYWFANKWITYENYVGAAAQFVAVDLDRAADAIVQLVDNDDLRRTMGANAREQARRTFDWAAIVPQYQALWAEQTARRRAAAPEGRRLPNPYRPDPYVLFHSYPSRTIQPSDIVALKPGMTVAAGQTRLAARVTNYSRLHRPTVPETGAVLAYLATNGPAPVARLLELVPPPRRNYLERGLIWMARYDVVSLTPV